MEKGTHGSSWFLWWTQLLFILVPRLPTWWYYFLVLPKKRKWIWKEYNLFNRCINDDLKNFHQVINGFSGIKCQFVRLPPPPPFNVCERSDALLWPTLCDPMDYNPLGSCPWDFPGKNTGARCHFLLLGSSIKEDKSGYSWSIGEMAGKMG